MIKPVNGHLLIEPLVHDSFIASQKESYEEIGVILDFYPGFHDDYGLTGKDLKVGHKVYFDSWLAAKYPKEGADGYYWLVKWEDVRAIEHE